jgi:hypothetical protein
LQNQIFSIYFVFQSAFMTSKPQPLETLRDIKQMMERSSRFISLSGLSGIAAGCCALVGAWFAYDLIHNSRYSYSTGEGRYSDNHYSAGTGGSGYISFSDLVSNQLFQIAVFTFIAALAFSFLFTYLRSRKTSTPLWGTTARRLMLNVSLPMIVGGIYLWKMVHAGVFGLIAPGCLIFYGLALVNASKYTLKEVRYLGYGQMILGIINLWFIGYGIFFWAIGFGVLHILYGTMMWWKYEKPGA